MRISWSNFALTSALIPAAAAWLALFQPASAQTSVYQSMTLTGDFNGWDPGRNNMGLLANEVWERVIFLDATDTNEFKFAANGSFAIDWGEFSQPNTRPPISDTADRVGGAPNIRIAPVMNSPYRFTLNSTGNTYSVVRLFGTNAYANTNLIKNPGFEIAGDNSAFDARYWKPNNRYGNVGDAWGSAARQNYRSYQGTNMMAIGTEPNFGGVWQDVPAGFGYDYQASGFFWADVNPPFGPWTAGVQQIKIEFFSHSYEFLGSAETEIAGVGQNWKRFSVRASAPQDTAWARLVVNVQDAGTKGSLQFDNLSMIAIPTRNEDFLRWATATERGEHSLGGWDVSNGNMRIILDPSYLRTIALGNTNAVSGIGGTITSANISNGIGVISFDYAHGSTDEENEPTNALSFAVRTSSDRVNWSAPVGFRTNVLSVGFQNFQVFTYQPNARYIQIQHTGGTNDLLIDNVEIAVPSLTKRFDTFDTDDWPSGTESYGCHTHNGWTICTGRVASLTFSDGGVAELAPSGTGTNYLTSPLLSNGIGKLQFDYARGTNSGNGAAFRIESSTDGTNWTVIDEVYSVVNSSFLAYENEVYILDAAYLRVASIFTTNPPGGAESKLIEEPFTDGNDPIDGWTFTGLGQYTSESSSGLEPNSLQFNSTGDTLLTPILSASPSYMTYWAKGNSAAGISLFTVTALTPTGNVTLTSFLPSNSEMIYSNSLPADTTQIQFSYTKDLGNVAFDDLTVFGEAAVGNDAPGLFIDNIIVGAPILYREQDFDDWPPQTSFGEYSFQGWTLGVRGIIDTTLAYTGKVGRLDNRANNLPYIQTPNLNNAIGPISFRYRNWDGSPAVNVQVQLSQDGVVWTNVVDSFSSVNTEYLLREIYVSETNYSYVRIQITGGTERLLIDEIFIDYPRPRATVSLIGVNEPAQPYTNDAVHLIARAQPVGGAQVTGVTSYYRVGTSGPYTAIPMAITNITEWGTVTPIAPLSTGSVVQYYFEAYFTGPGSSASSPTLYPPGGSTNPASYGIPRQSPNQVWINEVGYAPPLFGFITLPNFVELTGNTGIDMTGWTLEFSRGRISTNQPQVLLEIYNITNNVVFQDDFNGYGFWTIGNSQVSMANQVFTGKHQWGTNMPLAIRLLNEIGTVESAISFEGFVYGYDPVPASDFQDFTNTVSLTGAGENYSEFTWSVASNTPGNVNVGQYFGDAPPVIPPDVDVYRMTMSSTQIVIYAYGNTNNWDVAPYYRTNLANASESWTAVSPYSESWANGTNTVSFPIPASGNTRVYRLLISE